MDPDQRSPSPGLRILLCLLILAAGAGGMLVLKHLKQRPAVKPPGENPLPVTAVTVHPTAVPITLIGYGDAVGRTTVTLSSEVSGRIVSSARNLEAGRLVAKGELLFAIDERDYLLNRDIAQRRIQALERELEIARREFNRVQRLYRQKKVGSLSSVEKAESTVNSITNQIQQVRKNLDRANLDLERCRIQAPFQGRVTSVEVEKDEYITPGKPLLSLTDDSALEVVVALDSLDGARWLRLRDENRAGQWFPPPEPVPCTVTWSEDQTVRARGRMDRIVSFDPDTRTLQVAVAIAPDPDSRLPLVAGMFCRVAIPGRTLKQVYTIPREAVTFSSTVYLVRDGRLYSRRVRIVREQDGQAIIDQGLSPGDQVVVTRLQNPLEGTLVTVSAPETP